MVLGPYLYSYLAVTRSWPMDNSGAVPRQRRAAGALGPLTAVDLDLANLRPQRLAPPHRSAA